MKLIDPDTVANQMRTILKLAPKHAHEIETALGEHMKADHGDHQALCEAQLCVVEAVSCLADARAHLTGGRPGQLKAMVRHIRQTLDAFDRGGVEAAMIEREGATVH